MTRRGECVRVGEADGVGGTKPGSIDRDRLGRCVRPDAPSQRGISDEADEDLGQVYQAELRIGRESLRDEAERPRADPGPDGSRAAPWLVSSPSRAAITTSASRTTVTLSVFPVETLQVVRRTHPGQAAKGFLGAHRRTADAQLTVAHRLDDHLIAGAETDLGEGAHRGPSVGSWRRSSACLYYR